MYDDTQSRRKSSKIEGVACRGVNMILETIDN